MAKCFLTGVELPLKESYVFDIPVAHRVLRERLQKVAALEIPVVSAPPFGKAMGFCHVAAFME